MKKEYWEIIANVSEIEVFYEKMLIRLKRDGKEFVVMTYSKEEFQEILFKLYPNEDKKYLLNGSIVNGEYIVENIIDYQ